MRTSPAPRPAGHPLPGKPLRSLLAAALLAALWAASSLPASAAPVPATDNSGPPYMGLYGWGLDNSTAGEGMSHLHYTMAWLNRTKMWAEDFHATDSWASLTSVWPYKRGKAWLRTHPGKFISTVGMLPSGTYTLAAGAAGTYNAYWTTLAQNIVSQGIAGQTILRLGHEFNGTWYKWSVTNQTDAIYYAEYWRQIVTAMRAVPGAEGLQFCWNGVNGWNAYALEYAYPGDDYVDYIGPDIYDQSWAANTYPYTTATYPYGSDAATRQSNAWNSIAGTGNNGLAWWKNFAVARSKPLVIPEWGVNARTDSHGGLDNPFFVQKMYDFIQDPANNVAWHVYFDVWASDGNHLITQLPGKAATQFPYSAALIRKLFGVKRLPGDADIGPLATAGGSTPVSVTGAGTGYAAGGTADSFHLSSADITGDDTLLAKFTSMTSGAGSQAGLMLRQSTAADAPYAALYVKNGSCIFQSRTVAGTAAVQNFTSAPATLPLWLKLVRNGSAITGYKSTDGRNWTYAGGQTLAMNGTVKIGIAVASGSLTSTNTAEVDSVGNASIAAVDPGVTSAIMMDVSSTLGAGITTTGSWQSSGTDANLYGNTQLYNWAPATPTSMTFRPTIPATGLYEVYMRWWSGASHQFADCMPATITAASGTSSFLINQKVGAGLWNYLGTATLTSGTAGTLAISNTGCQGEENGYLRVDGVMFVPLPAPTGSAPGMVTGVTKGATTSASLTVTWSPTSGATGYNLSWNSSAQGYHSTPTAATSATITGLLPGTWYWIQVQATNSYGAGPWTSVYSFQTSP